MSQKLGTQVENLDKLYNSFITENNERGFYVGIYDYVYYVIENKPVYDTVKSIRKDSLRIKNKLSSEELADNKKLDLWDAWETLMEIYSAFSIFEGKNHAKIKKEVDALLILNMDVVNNDFDSRGIKKDTIRIHAKRIHNYITTELNKKTLSTSNEKTLMYFSSSKGFYDSNGLEYSIRKNRSKLITYLKDGKKDGKFLTEIWGHNSLQQLSKDISEINKLFKKKLKRKENIIINNPTGGYQLNTKIYLIEFKDE